jgi:hypothetical protein
MNSEVGVGDVYSHSGAVWKRFGDGVRRNGIFGNGSHDYDMVENGGLMAGGLQVWKEILLKIQANRVRRFCYLSLYSIPISSMIGVTRKLLKIYSVFRPFPHFPFPVSHLLLPAHAAPAVIGNFEVVQPPIRNECHSSGLFNPCSRYVAVNSRITSQNVREFVT